MKASKANKKATPDVSAYLEKLPNDRRDALVQLRTLILKTLRGVDETMTYRMPTYERNGEFLCAIASQKNHLCLYVCNPEVVNAHRAELSHLNLGKGCIRFKRIEDLPRKTVASILRAIDPPRNV